MLGGVVGCVGVGFVILVAIVVGPGVGKALPSQIAQFFGGQRREAGVETFPSCGSSSTAPLATSISFSATTAFVFLFLMKRRTFRHTNRRRRVL